MHEFFTKVREKLVQFVANNKRIKMLKINNLTVKYGEVTALKDVTLNIQEGELVAMIGSNGAGKTTMMNTISGLLKPTNGDILFKGKSVVGIPAHEVAGLGIAHVPEGRKVFASLPVKDNLLLGAYLRMRKGDKKAVLEDIEKI